jgi:hypothetical protein
VGKTKDVRAAVEAELGFDPLVDSADIKVMNVMGDVTLAGTVPSYPQYVEAAAAARRVAGVSGVHHNLMVDGAGGPRRSRRAPGHRLTADHVPAQCQPAHRPRACMADLAEQAGDEVD